MESIYLSTISSKGQLTLPKKVREKLHLQTGELVRMELSQGGVLLKKTELQTVSDDFSDEEWDVLRKMASEKGRRYSTRQKFLSTLK